MLASVNGEKWDGVKVEWKGMGVAMGTHQNYECKANLINSHNTFPCKSKEYYLSQYSSYLVHFSLETPKRVTDKQSRPRSKAAECGI